MPPQRIYRITASGDIEQVEELLSIGGSLTPEVAFALPSGYMGERLASAAAAELGLPARLSDWRTEHAVEYLFSGLANLSGDPVFGDLGLARELIVREVLPTPAARKLQHYVSCASSPLDATWGYVGGQQPKFLALVEDVGHVIVKHAIAGTPAAEALAREHQALRDLEALGVPAAQTRLLEAGGLVFLEVQRFDRVGRNGRRGMLSAAAVDDEHFGMRDDWQSFARRCVEAGFLSPADAGLVDRMVEYSVSVGNHDRHFENLSLMVGHDGQFAGLAPAYDIVPA